MIERVIAGVILALFAPLAQAAAIEALMENEIRSDHPDAATNFSDRSFAWVETSSGFLLVWPSYSEEFGHRTMTQFVGKGATMEYQIDGAQAGYATVHGTDRQLFFKFPMDRMVILDDLPSMPIPPQSEIGSGLRISVVISDTTSFDGEFFVRRIETHATRSDMPLLAIPFTYVVQWAAPDRSDRSVAIHTRDSVIRLKEFRPASEEIVALANVQGIPLGTEVTDLRLEGEESNTYEWTGAPIDLMAYSTGDARSIPRFTIIGVAMGLCLVPLGVMLRRRASAM